MKSLPALLLTVALSSCAEQNPRVEAHAYRLAHAPALVVSDTPEAEPAPQGEPPEPDGSVYPPELVQLEERLGKACKLQTEPISTAEMLGYAWQLQRCARRRMRTTLASLGAERRAALLGNGTIRDWFTAWSAFVSASCHVADAEEYSNRFRYAGSMRGVERASCFSAAEVRGLYWLEHYRDDDARSFAPYVRSQAELGRQAVRHHRAMAAASLELAKTSFESGVDNEGCYMCTLGDADFRKLSRTLAVVRVQARQLGASICSAWPELRAELGGDACAGLVESGWSVPADAGYGQDDQWRQAAETPPSSDDPPPKDADYAGFIEPILLACELEPPSNHLVSQRTSCVEAARQRELTIVSKRQPSAARDVEAAFLVFERSLCGIEAVASSFEYAGWMRESGEPECRLLSRSRAAFFAHSWQGDDVEAFNRHVEARHGWSERVEVGLGRTRAATEQPLCTDDAVPGALCRSRYIDAATWRRAAYALSSLHSQAQDLSRRVCAAWPSLASSTGDCEGRMGSYFISYGQTLGLSPSKP